MASVIFSLIYIFLSNSLTHPTKIRWLESLQKHKGVCVLIVIWFLVFLILYKGVGRIGKVVALTVPIPTLLLIILTIRGLTLPGAIEGVSYYLTPDFSHLGDVNVSIWLYR